MKIFKQAEKPQAMKKSQEIRDLLGGLPDDVRKTYSNVLALDVFIKERSARLGAHILNANDGDISKMLNPANAVSGIAAIIMNDECSYLAAAKALFDHLAVSDRYKEAEATIEPLIAELQKQETAEEAERVRIEHLKQAVRDAERTAQERSLSQAPRDPAVIAAKLELEKAIQHSEGLGLTVKPDVSPSKLKPNPTPADGLSRVEDQRLGIKLRDL